MALLLLAAQAVGNSLGSRRDRDLDITPQQQPQSGHFPAVQPQQPQQYPPLPQPWYAEWDRSNQRYVFINPHTGERTLQHPSHPESSYKNNDGSEQKSVNPTTDAASPPPYYAPAEQYNVASSQLQQPNAWPRTIVQPVPVPADHFEDRAYGYGRQRLVGRPYRYQYGPRRYRGGLITGLLLSECER